MDNKYILYVYLKIYDIKIDDNLIYQIFEDFYKLYNEIRNTEFMNKYDNIFNLYTLNNINKIYNDTLFNNLNDHEINNYIYNYINKYNNLYGGLGGISNITNYDKDKIKVELFEDNYYSHYDIIIKYI